MSHIVFLPVGAYQ